MYCIRCGTEIEKGSRFCPMCGALQEAAGSTKKTAAAKQEPAARRNEKTSGNRSSAADRRPAAEGKTAQSSKRTAAQKPGALQRKSSSGSLTVVIISIFAIAAAAAAIFFVWSRTKENREDLVETAMVSESRDEDRETGEGGDKIRELFGLDKEDPEESAQPAGEELQESQEAESEAPSEEPEAQSEPAQEVPEASEETPEPTQTPTPAATPEPVVTAEVKKASKVTLSGYKKVTVSHAAATSELKQTDQPEIDNSANSAVDGDVITSWQENVRGYGEGEYLDFRLNTEYRIRAITFNMGNWRTEELYNDNSRPKDITIWLDQKSFHVTIPDGMTQYCVEFSGAVKASEVMVVVDSVYAGRQYDDTCISEITMYAE